MSAGSDHASFVKLERTFGRWIDDKIRRNVPTVRYGTVREIGPGRTAAIELDGPTAALTRAIPFGEHAPEIDQYVRVFTWPAREAKGAPESWIDAWVGTEIPAFASGAVEQTQLTRLDDDFVVRQRLSTDAAYRLTYGLDASDRPRELWGNGTLSDVRRWRSGAGQMTFDDGDAGRIELYNGVDVLLDAGNHGSTGDPHTQYVPKTFYARTAAPGLARVVRQGVLTTKATSAPGTVEASVVLPLGFTFAPFVLGMYTNAGRSVSVPDVVLNAAGQILDHVQLATEVVETSKTKVALTVYTSRPKGRAALSCRYLVLDRVGG